MALSPCSLVSTIPLKVTILSVVATSECFSWMSFSALSASLTAAVITESSTGPAIETEEVRVNRVNNIAPLLFVNFFKFCYFF